MGDLNEVRDPAAERRAEKRAWVRRPINRLRKALYNCRDRLSRATDPDSVAYYRARIAYLEAAVARMKAGEDP